MYSVGVCGCVHLGGNENDMVGCSNKECSNVVLLVCNRLITGKLPEAVRADISLFVGPGGKTPDAGWRPGRLPDRFFIPSIIGNPLDNRNLFLPTSPIETLVKVDSQPVYVYSSRWITIDLVAPTRPMATRVSKFTSRAARNGSRSCSPSSSAGPTPTALRR